VAPVADAVAATAAPVVDNAAAAGAAVSDGSASATETVVAATTAPPSDAATSAATSVPEAAVPLPDTAAAAPSADPTTDGVAAVSGAADPISGSAAATAAGVTPADGGSAAPYIQPHAQPTGMVAPPELTMPLHLIASPDTRLVIGGLAATALAGVASGVGILTFDQLLLRSCGASLRSIFEAVRLLPCRVDTDLTSATRVAMSRVTPRRSISPGLEASSPIHPPVKPDLRAPQQAGMVALTWRVPGGGAALRWAASALAALSSLLAGASAFYYERWHRIRSSYRARFHA
jgi:hypothetical protein